jgi:hypothetical protein
MSHGREVSSQEKDDATPLDPATNASIGGMQQNEALKAVSMLVIANDLNFLFFTIFVLFRVSRAEIGDLEWGFSIQK